MTDVACGRHGSRPATYVCKHVAESLDDGVQRGFWWAKDEEGHFQALCSACDDLPQHVWEQVGSSLGVMLCLDCFVRAAQINDVAIPAE
ncbi:MAG: hypothetical protein JWR84_3133 [Caulobacter sp.]|nr:hypothetical protein [Caulobacter sp.]